MLRFISTVWPSLFMTFSFQYISCYGLSRHLQKTRPPQSISIHLMLRFIFGSSIRKPISTIISIHLMLRFIIFLNHDQTYLTIFQYISCYGLSRRHLEETVIPKSFQYISCYGLSLDARQGNVLKGNFNTSHVTVYPNVVLQCSRYWRISIHLMLRFIMKNLSNMTLKQIISIHLMLRFIK